MVLSILNHSGIKGILSAVHRTQSYTVVISFRLTCIKISIYIPQVVEEIYSL